MYEVVQISQIGLVKGHPGMAPPARRGGRSGVGPHVGEVVLAKERQGYSLLFGIHKFMAHKKAEFETVKAVVYKDDELDEMSRCELMILENYHSSLKSPYEIGEMFLNHRRRFGLSQNEFSSRIKLGAGSIHHYESLILSLAPELAEMVKNGKLRFKEARCIADLKPDGRQVEVAKPFLDGDTSSVHVEKVVKIAKQNPKRSAKKIVETVLSTENRKRELAIAKKIVERVEEKPLEHRALEIAGDLAEMVFNQMPEVQRLRMMSSLRVLDSRLREALDYLQNPGEIRFPSYDLNENYTVPAPSKR